jgi:hypothetical protein
MPHTVHRRAVARARWDARRGDEARIGAFSLYNRRFDLTGKEPGTILVTTPILD